MALPRGRVSQECPRTPRVRVPGVPQPEFASRHTQRSHSPGHEVGGFGSLKIPTALSMRTPLVGFMGSTPFMRSTPLESPGRSDPICASRDRLAISESTTPTVMYCRCSSRGLTVAEGARARLARRCAGRLRGRRGCMDIPATPKRSSSSRIAFWFGVEALCRPRSSRYDLVGDCEGQWGTQFLTMRCGAAKVLQLTHADMGVFAATRGPL